MSEQETKLCKHCQTEIPKKAKVCPHCRKKQGGIGKIILIAIVVLILIIAMSGGGEEESSSKSGSDSKAPVTEEAVEISYTAVTIDEMMKELEGNALNASDKYKDQYLEVTGKLNVVDSSGSYISLYPDDDFAFIGIQCYIENDEQLDVVKTMSIGDTVTVKGKCTAVGEVMGYSLDIDEIVK